MYIQSKACYIQWLPPEDSVTKHSKSNKTHFVGCVSQGMMNQHVIGMTINICRQKEQVKGNTFLLFTVHVAAVNTYNDKVTVLLFAYFHTIGRQQ